MTWTSGSFSWSGSYNEMQHPYVNQNSVKKSLQRGCQETHWRTRSLLPPSLLLVVLALTPQTTLLTEDGAQKPMPPFASLASDRITKRSNGSPGINVFYEILGNEQVPLPDTQWNRVHLYAGSLVGKLCLELQQRICTHTDTYLTSWLVPYWASNRGNGFT